MTRTDTRPHILMIMPDQMRGDCMSLENHPVVQTPNLDGIANIGTHFRHAYTTCPSCVPARRCLMTSQFPSTNGMVGMTGGYPTEAVSLPQQLRDHGYETRLVGRHMHWYPESARYGYDHMVLGSVYAKDDDYARYLRKVDPEAGSAHGLGLSNNGYVAAPWHMDASHHPIQWTFRQAEQFMDTHDQTCPFFLTVSTYAPHPPLNPLSCYFDRYLNMELPDPAIGDWDEVPSDESSKMMGQDSNHAVIPTQSLRQSQAGYFGLINQIDDQVYNLYSKFRLMCRDEGRPWIVVFCSDHGEMLGDHYQFRKCEPYEGSARVPMFFAGSPDMGLKPLQRCDDAVCLEDIMPTLLSLANADIPDSCEGEDLTPILRGEKDKVDRPWVHGEHARQYSDDQANHYLTDGHYKYIWRSFTGQHQLFNLDQDPHELHDLARVDQHQDLVAQWRSRMIDVLKDRPEGFVVDGELVANDKHWPAMTKIQDRRLPGWP